MARLTRYVLPGQPQHVIQRGNNRSPTFFAEDDYRFYRACLKERANVTVALCTILKTPDPFTAACATLRAPRWSHRRGATPLRPPLYALNLWPLFTANGDLHIIGAFQSAFHIALKFLPCSGSHTLPAIRCL